LLRAARLPNFSLAIKRHLYHFATLSLPLVLLTPLLLIIVDSHRTDPPTARNDPARGRATLPRRGRSQGQGVGL
jgi:hypothetical protein